MRWVSWTAWASLFIVITVIVYSVSYQRVQELLLPTFSYELTFHPIDRSSQNFELPTRTVTIGMAGDVLLHKDLNNYEDYRPSFSGVREMTQSLDFFLINLESLAAGEAFELSGYPNFNSTDTIVDGLVDLGSDLVMVSNNHTLDKRPAGLRQSLANLQARDLPYVGAYASEKDAATKRIFEVDALTIGVVSYTYGLNGHIVPADQPYLVDLIDVAKIQSDIRDLDAEVDLVIALMHWGTEYELEENEEQNYLATIAHQAGADIIFGGHPHVLQPYEVMESGDKKTHIFYSLGNFFSGQTIENTNYGGVAVLSVETDGDDILAIEPSFYPTEVTFTPDRVVVNPMPESQASFWTNHIGVPLYE